jgi:lysophospholipase L1-like esterase
MPQDAELIVIAAGTNDHTYALAPLGTFDDRTPFTFYGALHLLCLGLLERYIGKQLVFATPIKRHNGNYINKRGESLELYADTIKEVCAHYGIPVLDMFRECTLNPGIPSQLAAFFDDTSHPNQAGHAIMARRWIGYLKQLLV